MGTLPLTTMPASSVLAGPSISGRSRTAHLALLGLLGASLLALTPTVRADQGNIVLGSGLGAVAGAIIGHSVGGRDGAIVGGAIGGAVGASAASNGSGYRTSGPPPRYGRPVVVAPYPAHPTYPTHPSYPSYPAYPVYQHYPAYGGPPPRYVYEPVRHVRPVQIVQPVIYRAPAPVYGYGWGHRPGGWEGRGRHDRHDRDDWRDHDRDHRHRDDHRGGRGD